MERVQTLIEQAYDGEPTEVLKKRIAWRFLNGIRNKEVQSVLIKEKWMKNKNEAKEPEEFLRIADVARLNAVAINATGNQSSRSIASIQGDEASSHDKDEDKTAAAFKEMDGKKKRNRQRVFCEYCKREHVGGWQKCYKRLDEDPDWVPPSSSDNKGKGTKQKQRPRQNF